MIRNLFKKYLKPLILLILPLLFICALIQCVIFSAYMKREIDVRYNVVSNVSYKSYNEAEAHLKYIQKYYGKKVAEVHIYAMDGYSEGVPTILYYASYTLDLWVDNPPTLTYLLSKTTYLPLIIGTVMLLITIIIVSIERDYRPNKSVVTLLRLPRPRSRYLLSKLVIPIILMFLFWGAQSAVTGIQTREYFNSVPKAVRPISSSPWLFDYYRILFPVVEPIWFFATICALCMIPITIVTIVFIAKGGMKSWIYIVLPVIGIAAVVLLICRIANTWWLCPILLAAEYLNCRMLIYKGQIVQ